MSVYGLEADLTRQTDIRPIYPSPSCGHRYSLNFWDLMFNFVGKIKAVQKLDHAIECDLVVKNNL